jgi:hypothetical protein
MRDGVLPMGKTIKSHHGTFNLLTEIYGVEMGDNHVIFDCEDGSYEAKLEDGWKIVKI